MHKKAPVPFFLLCLTTQFVPSAFAQNVGIGLVSPAGKLHIKGASNASQLIIDAYSTQSNSNPLLRLRSSNGLDLLGIHADDTSNVFIGLLAGKSNVIGPQGVNNTFIGSRAGYSNTNGRDNTVVGYHALYSNVKGSLNTAIGTNALYAQSFSAGSAWWESKNVAVGHEALFSNQPTNTGNGQSNTAIGTSAMRANTTGYQNIGVGAYALYLNSSGNFNAAAGYSALNSNTTGNYNIAIGTYALFSNTVLSENIAIGYGALFSQSATLENWLGGNVAIGHGALYANQPAENFAGSGNTAIGNYALTSNISGSQNTACGYHALHNDIIGSYNTAFGYRALYANTGKWNTAMGWEALVSNTTGEDNTASGYASLNANTTGTFNTAMGYGSLNTNTTGQSNTAIGYNTLYFNTGGHYNIAIGSNSGTADYVPNAANTVSIGNEGYLNGASNQAFLGNLSTGWNGGNQTWSTFSDARMKNNIEEDVKGLDFILRLRPVTYHRSINAARTITGNPETRDYPEKYDVEKVKESGFLAQEVEQAAIASGYDFSGFTIPKHEHDLYTLSYEQFVVPLVKAIQELVDQIDGQQTMINDLMKHNIQQRMLNEELTLRMASLETLLEIQITRSTNDSLTK